MSRDICRHCGEVFSTTASPNNIEGYFIDDVNIERFHGDPSMYATFRTNGGIRGVRCPRCGMITPDDYPNSWRDEKPGLTVSGLIEHLKNLPQDMEVIYGHGETADNAIDYVFETKGGFVLITNAEDHQLNQKMWCAEENQPVDPVYTTLTFK